LIIAVEKDYIDLAKWLIDAGANVNAISKIKEVTIEYEYVNTSGSSALINAVKKGRINLTRWLIKAGAGVSIRDCDGNTALIIAMEKGIITIISWLIEASADLNAVNRKSQSAFYLSKILCFYNIIKIMKRDGVISLNECEWNDY